MNVDMPNQFSSLTVFLHWVVALTMIGLLAVGVYMVETESYSLYPWHKSFGFLIIFFVVLRVAWRIRNGWPSPVGQYSNIEHGLAKITHWTLITGTLLMPISGFLMSALSGHGVDVFGFEVVAQNIDPKNPEQVIAYSETISGLSHTLHHWLGYILIAAVILHVLGAIKHHMIDKDDTLKRMLGKPV